MSDTTNIHSFVITMLSPKSFAFLAIVVELVLGIPADRSLNHRRRSHEVEGVGQFQKHSKYTFDGPSLPEGLRISNGELINDQNHGAPYNHIFEASNVVLADGFLEIKVPGGQTPATAPNSAISAGEVFTLESDILYGSVRTKAMLSTVSGTVQGIFFYRNDTQEIDIEFLSDPASKANAADGASLHYTNQPTNGGSSTTSHRPPPSGVDTLVHEYRIDWTHEFTAFYLDGVLQQKYTTNVPSVAGTWLWNNWANGDIQWSAGPPAKDSVMKIKSIEMYYNATTAGSH